MMWLGLLRMEYDIKSWCDEKAFGGWLAFMNSYLEDPDFQFIYNDKLLKDAVHLDAGTSDVTAALANRPVIGVRGRPRPVASSKLVNANIGELPRVLWYIQIRSGVRDPPLIRYQPFTGLKHGKNKKWHETDEAKRSKVDEGEMHHDTRPYTRYLTDAEKQHIIDQQYAIPAKAFKKYDKQHGQGALASEIKKRPFTPLLFLVRRQARWLQCTPSHERMPCRTLVTLLPLNQPISRPLYTSPHHPHPRPGQL